MGRTRILCETLFSIHVVVLMGHLAGLSISAYADQNPNTCFKSFLNDWLSRHPISNSELDQKMIAEIELISSGLSKTQRARFSDAIKRLKADDLVSWGVAAGKIKLRPVIRKEIAEHPYSRIVIVHEADHLSRMINPIRWRKAYYSKDGLFEEERKAFQREYSFIRKVYTLKDLENFKKQHLEYPSYPAHPDYEFHKKDVELLRKFSVRIVKDRSLDARARDVLEARPEIKNAYLRCVRREMDAAFLDAVSDALLLTKEEYARMQLNAYDSKQRLFNTMRILQYGYVAVALPLGGYLLWDMQGSRTESPAK